MEKWKDIPNYEGIYQVSNLGRIKSLNRIAKGIRRSNQKLKERILKHNNDKDGYYVVSLSKDNKVTQYRVHRLVLLAFVPNPENKPQGNHKDGVKTNNFVDNLEWVTAKENTVHAWGNGLCNNTNKKKVLMLSLDNELLLMFDSITKASLELGINKTCISECCSNKQKTAGKYKWKFYTKETKKEEETK